MLGLAVFMLTGSLVCVLALTVVRRMIPESRPVARFSASFLRFVFAGYVVVWAAFIVWGI